MHLSIYKKSFHLGGSSFISTSGFVSDGTDYCSVLGGSCLGGGALSKAVIVDLNVSNLI